MARDEFVPWSFVQHSGGTIEARDSRGFGGIKLSDIPGPKTIHLFVPIGMGDPTGRGILGMLGRHNAGPIWGCGPGELMLETFQAAHEYRDDRGSWQGWPPIPLQCWCEYAFRPVGKRATKGPADFRELPGITAEYLA